ncbi:MAG: TrkA family potassium uptake protein, partial [Clostridia bacterium]
IDHCSTHAIVADATDENTLKSVGIANFDTVIVCTSDINQSILITLLCKELGVRKIVAKAQNRLHKVALQKIGADVIVFPEEYMGHKIAQTLANPNYVDVTSLSEHFKLIEVATPKSWVGTSLQQLDTRKNYGVSIILVTRADGAEIFTPNGDTVLYANDILAVGGSSKSIESFTVKVIDRDQER